MRAVLLEVHTYADVGTEGWVGPTSYGACFLVMGPFSAWRGRRPPASCQSGRSDRGVPGKHGCGSRSRGNASDDFGVPGSGWQMPGR